MLADDQRPHGLDADVRGEDEELDGDELLGTTLGGLGHHARTREAPDDDDAGEPLDRRVEAEADQRDRPRHHTRRDRDDPLDAHRPEREPRQQPHPPRKLAVALARDRGDRPRRRRDDERKLDRRAHTAATWRGATAARSARPRSVSSYRTILPS